MRYHTCCIHSTSELIDDLNESREEVSLDEFSQHCPDLEEWAVKMKYDGVLSPVDEDGGLLLKDDWHVEYYKGEYDGHPCYFLRHSGIEHIWIEA